MTFQIRQTFRNTVNGDVFRDDIFTDHGWESAEKFISNLKQRGCRASVTLTDTGYIEKCSGGWVTEVAVVPAPALAA